ncbi:hypothetical protein WR25_25433 [Diploscapter pachys]|uniref:Uncharacterized protein n=1 Tax=Diploscapter pachys TaxID=2018661 RepID=A0A2A2K7L6_9BILA|nr:hypothetical protein WR25_25433 [Diploscapter pachys]
MGLLVDPGGAFAKGGTGAVQGGVHRPQMGIGVWVGPRHAAMLAQVVGQGLGRAIPAGGYTGAAMPESGTSEVLAGQSDGQPGRVVEFDADAGGGGHAHRLPLVGLDALAGVRQLDGHQLRLVILPGSDQCPVDLQRTRAPGLAPLQAHLPVASVWPS